MEKTQAVPRLWQWKAVEYVAYLVTIIVPLAVARGQLFSFTTVKSFILAGGVLLMAALYLWGKYLQMKAPEASIHLIWLQGTLLVFAVILGLSSVFGVDPQASWFGTFHLGTGLVYIYVFILWSLLVGSLIKNNKSFLKKFLVIVFSTGAFVAFLSFFGDTVIRNSGGGSTLGNSSFLGAYLLFIFCIGVGLLFYYRKIWQRILSGIGLLVVLLSPVFFNTAVFKGDVSLNGVFHNPTILAGTANGAVVGLGIAVLILLGLFATRSQKKSKRIAGIILCIMVASSVLIGGYQLINPKSSLHQEFISQKSGARFVYWDMARSGFLASPILGYGWGNYDRVMQDFFNPILFTPGYAIEPSILEPHNVIWSYASTTGILGLVSYLLLVGGVFVVLYRISKTDDRENRIFGIVLASSVVGYFLQNMFVFDTPVSYLMFFSVVGVALGWMPARKILINKKYKGLVGAVSIIGGSVCVVGFIFLVILPWHESKVWHSRITNAKALTESPQSISVIGNANDTAYVASNFYVGRKGMTTSENEKLVYVGKLKLLLADLDYDISHQPNNYKPYLVKGIIENGLVSLGGKIDPVLVRSARSDLEKAIKLNPRTPESYFNLTQTALYEHNSSDAYQSLRKGIELAPTYDQGYVLGEAVLKIAPNKEFEKYLKDMKIKWLIPG